MISDKFNTVGKTDGFVREQDSGRNRSAIKSPWKQRDILRGVRIIPPRGWPLKFYKGRSPMKNVIFGCVLEKKISGKRWMYLPLSVIAHATIIASVVLVPLLNADSNLPEMKEYGILMVSPAPIPRPGVPGRKGNPEGKIQRENSEGKKPPQPVKRSGILIAPVVIPDTIEDEEDIYPEFSPGLGDSGIAEGFEDGDGDVLLGPNLVPTGIDDTLFTPVERPRLIKKVIPRYPEIALRVRATDTVIVEATTDTFGRVSEARVIKGHPLLNQAAIDAVRLWVYEPFLINGVPKPVRFTVFITFRLDKT